MNLDDLELELRRLPGVRAAGFVERDGVLLVQLQVGPGEAAPAAAFQATRIAYRHSERPVAVEIVRWRDVPVAAAVAAPTEAGGATEAPTGLSAPAEAGAGYAGGERAGFRETPTGTTEEEQGAPGSSEKPAGVGPEGGGPAGAGPDTGEPAVGEQAGGEPTGGADEYERGWIDPEAPEPGPTGEHPPPEAPGVETVFPPPGETVSEAVGEPLMGAATAERRVSAEEAIAEPRVRLLAVLTFPDTDELEVHLTFGGRRSIGRADSGLGLLGAVEATIHALRVFVPALGYSAAWARTLESTTGEAFLVACTVSGERAGARHGLAAGTNEAEAAARATLHSLNRTLALQLAAAG